MLRTIHRNKGTLMGVLVISAVVLMMTGFGVNLYTADKEIHAITIDDFHFNTSEFLTKRRELQERYRNMLGKNYPMYAKALEANLSEQVIDSVIQEQLFYNTAYKRGFRVSDRELQEYIASRIFQGNFDPNLYKYFLDQRRQSSKDFENELKKDLLSTDFRSLLHHISVASQKEAATAIKLDETLYDISYLKIDPDKVSSEIKEPPEDVLKTYYEENATDFETQPLINYDFSVLEPAAYLNLVEVNPEDVEFYYTEHQSQFTEPEKWKIRQIFLSIPKDADDATKKQIKEKADTVLGKAVAGEDFVSLVKQYSDELTTRDSGGDMGWLTRGKMDKDYEKSAFSIKVTGIAPLVEKDTGYYIVKVEEYLEKKLKPLDEVKAQIESEIRKREVPAYVAAKSEELFDSWNASNQSLADFGKANQLGIRTGTKLLKVDEDPSVDIKGLTALVIKNGTTTKQVVDLKDKSILVEVKEFKEKEVPGFSTIKDKVFEAWRKEEAVKTASKKADLILSDLKEGKYSNLDSASEAYNVEFSTEKGISKTKGAKGVLANNDVQSEIFSVYTPNEVPSRTFNIDGKYYLFQVSSITPPKEEDVKEKVKPYISRESMNLASVLNDSMLNRLKANSKIEVNQALLAVE